jgi:hypothetical protein
VIGVIFDSNTPMKKYLLLVLLLPLFSVAQQDFETRYFTIDATSLPEVTDLMEFSFDNTPLVKRSLNEFDMNVQNYRKPVDMASVVSNQKKYVAQGFNIKGLESQYNGFGSTAQYTPDGSTQLVNPVYKDMSGFNAADTCPPFGICPRCAHYRVGRRR